MKKSQLKMFEDTEEWKEHWQDMPEFSNDDLMPYNSVIVHFATQKDMLDFMETINQRFTKSSKFIWFPEKTRNNFKEIRYLVDAEIDEDF